MYAWKSKRRLLGGMEESVVDTIEADEVVEKLEQQLANKEKDLNVCKAVVESFKEKELKDADNLVKLSDKKNEKIKELEAALAEMTKQRDSYARSECKLVEQVGDLEAKLAEAEAEIKRREDSIRHLQTRFNEVEAALAKEKKITEAQHIEIVRLRRMLEDEGVDPDEGRR